ncbi:aryl hydrocarbon receptor-like [Tigriopus californicus]|uniref:aryl hydrocarbon receptor-like n=1 Tax=Tigriopus californicus TaxID=6832 RepID=UPI0027DAAF4E|nr:aryl hydrocarbon receptor-like [Tigriopus californicus]
MNMNPNPLSTVYATKRRRRSNKSLRPSAKDNGSQTKSNPSKRHRERLNGELDHLASLLPFESNILSKLDRLSILRLAVAFLRTKTFFQVAMHREKDELLENQYKRDFLTYDNQLLDGDIFLQALNGFLMILDCNGELFFATHSIETYLGFHQSDVIHQSVYELVHSEDREELQKQLTWNTYLPNEDSNLSVQDVIQSDSPAVLERSFTVRFRCLLDNTSGFLRLDIRGRIKVLHGQNKKSEDPPLALFCLCTPFGPPSLLEIPQKEVMFKSKHKLDFTYVSLDSKGKELLGYEDREVFDVGGYDLVHYDDLAYVASAHQELLKTGASGMIAYRILTKDLKWQWLQTSSRLVYKNSKPDFIISTHRPLMEEEGRDLLGKRTMDFKVTYLDVGLTSSYLSDHETSNQSTGTTNGATPTTTKSNKRYKTHLRDFLSSCKSKRKSTNSDLAYDTSTLAYATMYSQTSGNSNYPPEGSLYMQQNLSSPYQSIYSSVDNRYFSPEYLASYRSLTTYYPEYAATAHAAQYLGNSYFTAAAAADHNNPVPAARPLGALPYDVSTNHLRYFDEKAHSGVTEPSPVGLSGGECKYTYDEHSQGSDDKMDGEGRSRSKNADASKREMEKLAKGVKCEPYPEFPKDP